MDPCPGTRDQLYLFGSKELLPFSTYASANIPTSNCHVSATSPKVTQIILEAEANRVAASILL
jgi:hypothetical protein